MYGLGLGKTRKNREKRKKREQRAWADLWVADGEKKEEEGSKKAFGHGKLLVKLFR